MTIAITYGIITILVASIAAGILVWTDFFIDSDDMGVFFGAIIGALWPVTVPLAALCGLVWLGHRAVVTWLDEHFGGRQEHEYSVTHHWVHPGRKDS